jgi:type IV pilus assembly protein PilE
MKPTTRGFTLIELVITVAVLALIAALAVPSYRQYVLRSHRVEATTALMQLAAAQEKFYLQNDTYTTNLGAPPTGLGLSADAAKWLTESGWYEIAVTAADDESYSATATIKAGGGQDADTACTSFTVTSTGARSATQSKCWD